MINGLFMQDQEQLQQHKILLCHGCDSPDVYKEGFCYRCYCEVKALGWLR